MRSLILLAFATVAAATFGCRDKSSNCSSYDKGRYCKYEIIRKICKKHCGLCVTTPAPGCRNKYSKCYKFTKSVCKYSWFKANCKKHCGLCSGVSTKAPTQQPTSKSSKAPTQQPTSKSSKAPTQQPTSKSSKAPTQQPTKGTTQRPTIRTTQRLTNIPTQGPSNSPSQGPSNGPSQRPTNAPTKRPTQPQGQCGRPQVAQSRVVGGQTATAHSWPWQIGLHHRGRFMCGGSVINSRWVVTAAHCVDRRLAKDFTVKLGDHDREAKENEQTIQVRRVIAHEKYGRLNNDIALLELEKPVMFGKHVQPVCLPKQGDKPAVGSTCYITGWGKIRHPGSSTRFLQQLGLKIQAKNNCHVMNGKYAPITDQMLCAANPETSANQSGCHGDSGGPFVCQNGDSSWTLHGAVSWGSPRCDIKDAFTVFARVAEFRNWMDQFIV